MREATCAQTHHQPALVSAWLDDAQTDKLKTIDHLLNTHPTLLDTVAQDIMRPGVDHQKGVPGMSVSQVVRTAFVKCLFGCSYPRLAFWLKDSNTIRRFCQYGLADRAPSASALQANISRITAASWEQFNTELVRIAVAQRLDNPRLVRLDCTPVAAPISPPTDSKLLWDAVRVLTRLTAHARRLLPALRLCDHCRRAKRRALQIHNAKTTPVRRASVLDWANVPIILNQASSDVCGPVSSVPI